MNGLIRSGLMAGLISAVIWMMISTAVGLGKAPVIVGGFGFLIGTGLVTAAVSSVINRSRTRT